MDQRRPTSSLKSSTTSGSGSSPNYQQRNPSSVTRLAGPPQPEITRPTDYVSSGSAESLDAGSTQSRQSESSGTRSQRRQPRKALLRRLPPAPYTPSSSSLTEYDMPSSPIAITQADLLIISPTVSVPFKLVIASQLSHSRLACPVQRGKYSLFVLFCC